MLRMILFILIYGNLILSVKQLTPISVATGQPTFEEPWQAQALAMADLLIQSDRISATDWSEALGEQLTIWQSEQDTQENYYQAVLAALTELIEDRNLISNNQIVQREEDWKQAYLSTPHGQPVKLTK